MSGVLNAIYSAWNQIVYAVSNLRILDILDILVIAFIIYKAIGFLRTSRAGQLFKGILILLAVYVISIWWDLVTLKWLLSKIVDAAIMMHCCPFSSRTANVSSIFFCNAIICFAYS